MTRWRRTWPDRSYDFIFERDGKKIGRIYRHTDKTRWQWFRWVPETANGVCATKNEAARMIDDQSPGAPSDTE